VPLEHLTHYMLAGDPRPLLALAGRVSHEASIVARRFDNAAVFDRRRMATQLTLVLDHLLHPLNLAYRGTQYLLHWETPAVSGGALGVALVLVWGLPPTLPLTLPGVLCSVQLGALGVLCCVLGARGRGECSAALVRRRGGGRSRGIVEGVIAFRRNLGVQQSRLLRVNAVLLRVRALYTGRDGVRTGIYAGALAVGALVFAVLPSRLWATALLLFYFTRIFRDPGQGLLGMAWSRWWGGLPCDPPPRQAWV
jgi:hypothetical protein